MYSSEVIFRVASLLVKRNILLEEKHGFSFKETMCRNRECISHIKNCEEVSKILYLSEAIFRVACPVCWL